MSTINDETPSPKQAARAALDPPPLLSPEQFIEQLRMLQQQIPNFVQLPKNRETDGFRRMARSVTLEFAHEATNAVGVSSVVEAAIGNTPEGMHQAEDLAGRWAAVENEARSLLRGLSSTNLVLRQGLCKDAVQAYNVSRELVKQQEHSHLLPHVEAMRRLKKGRRRPKPVIVELAPKPELVTKLQE
jgi:hypothetical protein